MLPARPGELSGTSYIRLIAGKIPEPPSTQNTKATLTMKPHNKPMSFLAAALTGACSLLFFSCAKEAGPAGPQGPQGPAGAQGQAGPAGNANVKSYTLFITGSEWTNDGNYSYVTKQLPEISADII